MIQKLFENCFLFISLTYIFDQERKTNFIYSNQLIKTVKTKNQKMLESFKTEKPLNKILLKFLEKQSIDLSKQSIDFCLIAKAKTKLFQIILKSIKCQTTC